MPHFFITENDIKNNIINVTDSELVNHLVNARRIKTGEKILFIDENKIQYETIILSSDKKSVSAKITNCYKSDRELDIDITVAKCVLKQDADFSSIQKATELGVKTIIPIISDNCAVSKKLIKLKSDKFQKIANESVKQCERADFPTVFPPIELYEFLQTEVYNYNKILVFSERENKFGIKDYFNKNPYQKGDKILAIIGCEGGFSQNEFDLFEKLKLQEITLGKLILRADTALTAAIYGIILEIS